MSDYIAPHKVMACVQLEEDEVNIPRIDDLRLSILHSTSIMVAENVPPYDTPMVKYTYYAHNFSLPHLYNSLFQVSSTNYYLNNLMID